MIRYALFENKLTADPDDCKAAVQPISTKSMEDLVDIMISRGSTVTKAEALSVMEELAHATIQALKDGHNVVTPLFNLSISIKGVFRHAGDSFDPARHEILVRANPGLRLRQLPGQLKLEKVVGHIRLPVLESFTDVTSKTRNKTLTPGGVGKIAGSRLGFNSAEPAQGIFFTAQNGTISKVETLISVKPSEAMFVIPPSLSSGRHTLSVRSIVDNATELREGFLAGELDVA